MGRSAASRPPSESSRQSASSGVRQRNSSCWMVAATAAAVSAGPWSSSDANETEDGTLLEPSDHVGVGRRLRQASTRCPHRDCTAACGCRGR